MAIKSEYYEQLQAYALGCLDKADLVKLRNHIHSGEDYPWQELGEYQNLAALLPSILHVEVPGHQLKDKVARKLYRIRDEIRTKRTSELNSLRPTTTIIPPPKLTQAREEENIRSLFVPQEEEEKIEEEPPFEEEYFPNEEQIFHEEPVYNEEPARPEEQVEEIPLPPVIDYTPPKQEEVSFISHTPEFEVVTPTRKTSDFFRPPQETQIRERDARGFYEPPKPPEPEPEIEEEEEDFYKNSPPVSLPLPPKPEPSPGIIERRYLTQDSPEKEVPAQKNNMIVVILMGILFLILIVAGAYAYFTISSDVKSYKTEVRKLNEELKGRTDNNDVTKELQKMLAMPNTRIISLTSNQGQGFGKVIFNPDESRGYLQLGNMPQPAAGRVYQLWINAYGNNFVSLGLYSGSNGVEYYPFDLPELSNMSNISVLLTDEPSSGSERPGRKTFLHGTL